MKMLALVLAGVLYAIGWLTGMVAVAVKWVWNAMAVGWDDAHRLALTPRNVDTPPTELRAIPTAPGKAA